MIRPRPKSALAGISAVTLLSVTTASITTSSAAHAHPPGSGGCLDRSVALSVEESRLTFTLPDNDNPAVLQSKRPAKTEADGGGGVAAAPRPATAPGTCSDC